MNQQERSATQVPLVVVFHTGGPYCVEAARLRWSLKRFGLEYEIDELEPVGNWTANNHLRAGYLIGKQAAHPGRHLLSLDADAVLLADPMPYLTQLDCDVAVHYLRDIEPLPGTLWLSPTTETSCFLAGWKGINAIEPRRADRVNCGAALDQRAGSLRVARLPPEYCYIYDLSREAYPEVQPVIQHWQASRWIGEVP